MAAGGFTSSGHVLSFPLLIPSGAYREFQEVGGGLVGVVGSAQEEDVAIPVTCCRAQQRATVGKQGAGASTARFVD